ncbi:MAG: Gfo/Idh/MocA family oxidoreductase [Actinomycetota bacterium]
MTEHNAPGAPSAAEPAPPIGYGIIGTGMMGVEHIHNIRAIDGARIVAISDPTETSRADGIEAVGQDVASYADHRELLANPEVDAVVVASPNFTHHDVLADVLDAGPHLLIEKPLCTTVEDCERVLTRAEATAGSYPDRIVQVGLEYRYMPAVARLLEEVAAGVVGTPRMVAIREHRFPFLVKVGNWNRFSANTGGTLVEKCCHFFDLMNLVIGERPTRVMASGAQDVNHLDEVYDGRPSDILDNAYVIVDYPNGARAMLDLCMFADATHNQEEVSVVGAAGKVEALLPEGRLRVGIRGEQWVGDVPGEVVDDSYIAYQGLHHGSSYVEHLDFLAAIRGDGEIPVTLEDGLWSVAMGVAAHRSIDQGRPVDLSELVSPQRIEAAAEANRVVAS